MKVIVARTAGFCWGVRRAMDAVLEASAREAKGPVQTLGPLIHNPQALELIKRRGVAVADRPDQVRDGIVVIRAHGIPIQDLRGLKERQKRGELAIVNATCPEVAKVHSRIKKWSPKGYFVVILGTHGHAESIAHQSFAEHGSAIVANLEEAKALTDPQLARALVVAQTTFTVKDFQTIAEYLRSRSGDCIVENTICEDTWTRQEEAREIAEAADYVIVVGGRASSNTKHLAELAQRYGKPVQFVETAAELDLSAFRGAETVGVMAGASTPTWLVEEVVDVLQQHGAAGRAHRLSNEAFTVPLKLAVGSGFLALGMGHWTGLPFTWRYPAITAAYALAMYLLTPYLDPLGLGSKGPGRARLLERSRNSMMWTAWLALVASFVLASSLGVGSLLVVGGASLFGLSYKRKLRLGRFTLSLRSIPGSKDVLVALALAVVALALPMWHDSRPWDARAWAGVLLVSALVFARTTTYNLKDMQNDQILGRETLPIVFGRRITKILLLAFLAVALAATLAVTFLHPGTAHPWLAALILTVCATYPVFHLWFFHERFAAGRRRFEPWVETGFYLAGLLALV
jgi:4-hydroxy-3-methylbut-2-enyl diphosphate reductase